MPQSMILASSSPTRAELLRAAGIPFTAHPARVDEAAHRLSLQAEGATSRDIADTLAEIKAQRLANRYPEALVIGADQVLDHQGHPWGKPENRDAGRAQLQALRGSTHVLHSAVVLYHQAKPVWRHLEEVRMTMRRISDAYIESYLDRHWDSVRHCVGCYKIEEEGIRLFSEIRGDHFSILGLPMLALVGYLVQRGFIDG
jgi:septum formation protein